MFKKYVYLKQIPKNNSLKKTLAIFLVGIILGVFLSQFTLNTPKQIITSPVVFSLAQTEDLVLPVTSGEILGVKDHVEGGGFGKILIEQKEAEVATQTMKISQQPEATGSLSVAVLGDSMVDTMGEGLPYLQSSLKKLLPNFQFSLYNYGVGAQDLDYGIFRLQNDYQYLGKTIPSLLSVKADIVVIESFANNPWGSEKSDLDRHWLSLAKAVEIVKQNSQAKIIILATIAPSKKNFGRGPGGVNWDQATAYRHAEKVNLYLENALRFAQSQNLPFVDAYHPSIINGDGNPSFISVNDGIHPSVAGCEFVSQLLAEEIAKFASKS